MSTKLKTALVSAGAAAVTALAVFGTATPAFAKSGTQLTGPRVAHVRHAFHLTVSVGDDGGARPARARLQVRGAGGRYHWFGPWRRLHLTDPDDESCVFTLTEDHRGAVTFRAVVSSGYAITNPATVAVR
jgi:hypothetical protein